MGLLLRWEREPLAVSCLPSTCHTELAEFDSGKGVHHVARYEGMEDILQRVRKRLGEPQAPALTAPPEPPAALAMPLREQQYLRTVDGAQSLLRSAETLKEMLSSEYVRTLNSEQQEHLLMIIGQIFHDLWAIEGALQTKAPYD